MRMNGANSILYTPNGNSIEVAARRSPDWDGAQCTRSRDISPARRTLDFCSVRPTWPDLTRWQASNYQCQHTRVSVETVVRDLAIA